MGKLVLREFNWSGFVEKGIFENILLAVVGAGLGSILIQTLPGPLPNWLFLNLPLSGFCLALAFLRVWKTVREEHESSTLWDEITRSDDPNDDILDRVFEIPYLFTLTVLPFTTIVPQIFVVTLLVFYFTDNYYNSALVRGVARGGPSAAPAPDAGPVAEASSSSPDAPSATTKDFPPYLAALGMAILRSAWMPEPHRTGDANRDRLIRYFMTRSRYDSLFMLVLVLAFVAATVMTAGMMTALLDAAWLMAAAVIAIAIIELVVEPRRNLGMTFEPDEPAA
jgi:hypothetical protein